MPEPEVLHPIYLRKKPSDWANGDSSVAKFLAPGER
jgi:hypothetical protein